MTEEEWLAGGDPKRMLELLRAHDLFCYRKAVLLAVAVWRPFRVPSDEDAAWDLAESYADGLATLESVSAEFNGSDRWIEFYVENDSALSEGYWRTGQPKQAPLLHDLFGNPFRPVAFDPAWRTTDVMLLANGIYEERAFDRMPILADALQDAGCDSDALLAHLRDPNATHVRGCWALDLVLGKE